MVTVPILDSRFAVSEARTDAKIEQLKAELLIRMEQIKSELVRWLFLIVIGNAAITAVIQRVH